MIIKEFRCEHERCGYVEELAFTSIKDADSANIEMQCPKCKGQMKRVWSAPNISIPPHMRAV